MRRALALFLACACLAQQPAPKKDSETHKDTKTQKDEPVKSFLVWLAQVSGLSATSSGLRGFEAHHQGDVWIGPVEGVARRPLTSDGGYSWPVFSADDQSVMALRGGDLWSVPLNGGSPGKLAHTLAGITILLGSGAEGVVVLTADRIGTFSPGSGVFTPFPASPEDLDTINRLRAPVRSYDNGQLTVSEKRAGILIVNRGQEREITSEGAALSQPSVSHDRKSLVYVRTDDSPR